MACRTVSATTASPGPTRASGCAASTCSSMPRPRGMRPGAQVPRSRTASRAIKRERASGSPAGPQALRRKTIGGRAGGAGARAARRSSTSPV
jgi:hypothetical protein